MRSVGVPSASPGLMPCFDHESAAFSGRSSRQLAYTSALPSAVGTATGAIQPDSGDEVVPTSAALRAPCTSPAATNKPLTGPTACRVVTVRTITGLLTRALVASI